MGLEEEMKAIDAVILTADQERQIDAAIERAKHAPPVVHGVDAYFDIKLRMLVIGLSNGRRLAIPQEDLQGVAGLTPAEAARFAMDELGVGVWWESIDSGFTIEGLRGGWTGNARWMEKLKAFRASATNEGLSKTA